MGFIAMHTPILVRHCVTCTCTCALLSSSTSLFGFRPVVKGLCSLYRPTRVLSLRRGAQTQSVIEGPCPPPNMPRKHRILSGIQPTGELHLGNYLGALRQWVEIQSDENDNFFCAVDLHAATVPYDPKSMTEQTYRTIAVYLAAGIDPKRSKIFVQSHVKAHSELMWLLSCSTPMSWLERMTQFKEKGKKQGESVAVGLFTYPVLMAADILLYQTEFVPVGDDQKQHLEFTRDIARRFNDQFCRKRRNVFKLPRELILESGARVMSLQDGTSKMSKSDPIEGSRINLVDSPDARKIRRCKTDSKQGLEWNNPDRPECSNLLTIYQAVTGLSRDQVAIEVQDLKWSEFKPRLEDAVIQHLEPLRKKCNELLADRLYLHKVIQDGADSASAVADETLKWAKDAMGLADRFHMR